MSLAANLVGHDLYGGKDPRDRPLYSFPEAARATEIPASTLRAWFVGTSYGPPGDKGFFQPVIARPDPLDTRLSFINLIESHVLRALRTVHQVNMAHIREAVDVAESTHDVTRLLISPELRASAGRLFLDRYTHLLELTHSRQMAMRVVLDQYLERIEYDETKLPAEFFPFERSPRNQGKKLILLSPFVSFGQPILQSRGVSTRAVVSRLDAGETAAEIQDDYGISPEELEEAVLFETAA